MKLVVGLGNPGKKYEKTRHNIGWQIVNAFLDKKEGWKKSKNANCFYLRKQINDQEVEVVKPLIFMNNSGQTVAHIQKKHNIAPEEIIVVHDDLDLPLGKIRVKINGSSGGHHGVQSIVDYLKSENFVRVKIGVANEKRNLVPAEKFVLEKFSAEEKIVLEKIKGKTLEILIGLLNKKEIKEETFSV